MGLRPGVRREPASRAGSAGPQDRPPAPGRSTAPVPGPPPERGPTLRGRRARRPPWLALRLPALRSVWASGTEESAGSRALVQLLPKRKHSIIVGQRPSVHQGKKLVITLEAALNQKRAELKSVLKSALKSDSEGKLVKQADEIKPRPRPGDLIEIFRIGYEHWAIYMEDDCVVHLAPPTEGAGAGSITSIFSNRAVVKYSRLEDVLHGCPWKINNKLDGTYLPLPVEKIMQRTRNMVNKIVQYSLMEGNCEHFVNDLRYGVPRSQQVEHVLRKGAKAAGAVISAVVDGIKPKPVTAQMWLTPHEGRASDPCKDNMPPPFPVFPLSTTLIQKAVSFWNILECSKYVIREASMKHCP
ncbi:phospholipase A and acyltransferase 5 [Thomomys bottae]